MKQLRPCQLPKVEKLPGFKNSTATNCLCDGCELTQARRKVEAFVVPVNGGYFPIATLQKRVIVFIRD